MEAFRYYLALYLVVFLTPMLPAWLLVHSFIHVWRRLGLGWTYGLVGAVIFLVAAGLFRARHTPLAVQFGTSYLLVFLGFLLLAVSSWLGLLFWRHLKLTTLLGVPEIAPQEHPVALITQGIYARIRHPRYVQFFLGNLGLTLMANYLAAYVAAALWLPGTYVIVLLKERELRQRFGPEYEEYCRRVPRFLPRFD